MKNTFVIPTIVANGSENGSGGKYLSLWNCATGLAETNPPTSPYTYKTGDYFIIGTVSNTTNYKPNGSSYITGVASTTVESEAIASGDCYYFDGTNWQLQINTQKDVAFQNIAGDPYSNTNLSTALNAKQNTLVSGTNIKTINGNSLLGSGNIEVGSTPTLTWYKNNTGTTITIADTSSANLVKVYKNGILLELIEDYSISGTTLTLVSAITDSDKITLEVF